MKQSILILPLLCLLSLNSLTAQKQGQAKIDSLLNDIKNYDAAHPSVGQKPTMADTTKVNLLIDASITYGTVNPDEGIKQAEQALVLAEKIGWKKGMAYANLRIGSNLYFKADYNKTAVFYSKALAIFEAIDFKQGIGKTYINMGNSDAAQGKYPQATEYYTKALRIYEALNNKEEISNCTNNIGII